MQYWQENTVSTPSWVVALKLAFLEVLRDLSSLASPWTFLVCSLRRELDLKYRTQNLHWKNRVDVLFADWLCFAIFEPEKCPRSLLKDLIPETWTEKETISNKLSSSCVVSLTANVSLFLNRKYWYTCFLIQWVTIVIAQVFLVLCLAEGV